MPKQYRENEMNDVEILQWAVEQSYLWQEEVWELSKAKNLQSFVNYIKSNFKQLKQLGNEKARTYRQT